MSIHFHLGVNLSDLSTSRLDEAFDSKRIAPDGRTIEERVETLCKDVARDIKECGNACDAYSK